MCNLKKSEQIKEIQYKINEQYQNISKMVLSSVLILLMTFQIGCGVTPSTASDDATVNNAHADRSTSTTVTTSINLSNIPEFSGTAYVEIHNNTPYFTEDEIAGASSSYEKYSELDEMGRCGVCIASVGQDIMPTEERGEIGPVKPTGWHTVKYNDIIDGNYLYNRCHLLGYQLTGENANEKNLITGTRYLNVDGMLPFENLIANYVKETNHHVLYRVTPIFEGDNLVASGVLMEAQSIEDDGAGVSFNVYCYNVQPQVVINYADGTSQLDETIEPTSDQSNANSSTNAATNSTGAYSDSSNSAVTEPSDGAMVWIPASGSKYHSNSTCSGMKNPTQVTKEEAESEGYGPCKKCY